MTTPEKRLDRVRSLLDKFLEDYPQLYKAHYQKRCGQSGITLIHINTGQKYDLVSPKEGVFSWNGDEMNEKQLIRKMVVELKPQERIDQSGRRGTSYV